MIHLLFHCQVYRYEEGEVAFVGIGHSSDITKVCISPNGKHIVSVSQDAAVLTWVFDPKN